MRPLYAAPPAPHAALREALEESHSVIEWLLEGRELDEMDRVRINKWSQLCQKADAVQPEAPAPGVDDQLRSSGPAEQSGSGTWTAGIDAMRSYPFQDTQWHLHAIEFHHKVREEAEGLRNRWLAAATSRSGQMRGAIIDGPQAAQVPAEHIARVIALSYGRDPDGMTEWTEMCDADDRPIPVWRVYEEQAESLLAAYSVTRPASRPAWQPIETAPKSSKDDSKALAFLAWCPDDTAPDGGGDQRIVWWEPRMNKGDGLWWGDRDLEEHPTHWKPLGPSPLSRPYRHSPGASEGKSE
jgi:hypothetical protein